MISEDTLDLDGMDGLDSEVGDKLLAPSVTELPRD